MTSNHDAGRVRFNLNDYVYVRLTDHGRKVYARWRDSLGYPFAEHDVPGDLRYQAWELLQIFGGPSLCMAGDVPFVDLMVEFETKDLKEVTDERG